MGVSHIPVTPVIYAYNPIEGKMSTKHNGRLIHVVKSYSVGDFFKYNISLLQTSIVQGIMVSHSEEDLLCIRVAYLKLTGTSLYTALQVGHTDIIVSWAQHSHVLF